MLTKIFMFFLRPGPVKVDKAFGLFNKAIHRLTTGMEQCIREREIVVAEIDKLRVKATELTAAEVKASVAINNIKELIGERD